MLEERIWDRVVAFHGHSCPGLAIGFKAVEGALSELELSGCDWPALDEEIVCVTENDACGVDAIQVVLSCTYGKSNLISRLRGKMAFSFFTRDTGKAVRLVFTASCPEGMERDAYQDYLLRTPYTELFKVTVPSFGLPQPARLFASRTCAACGEQAAEYGLRLQDGKLVCLDCYEAYDREGIGV
ncbi:MAG: FmdE family protein [Coriobacteriales bacterium]|jgi:formylmethanofuran dehydrogenase subunit E|nr:FmdE family protein [Coriobacteriales bacterium]